MKQLEPGRHLFSVATGRLSILNDDSRKAFDYIGGLDPVCCHIMPNGCFLWFFDSLGRARWVRNHMKLKGFEAIGNYVTEFVVAADGVPEALSLDQQPEYGGEDE